MTGNKSSHPAFDEIEVSLFGSGFGECVCIHIGNFNWVVVDSLIDEGNLPIAQSYLQGIGVSIDKQVRLIVATHWHDDHIKGLSKLLGLAASAGFACTGSLQSSFVQSMLSSWNYNKLLPNGSGGDEICAILNQIALKNPATKIPHPILAVAGRLLPISGNSKVTIKALSPSDGAILLNAARNEARSNWTEGSRTRIPNLGPNDTSVVLSINIDQHEILLGADLEVCTDPSLGWNPIIESGLLAGNKFSVYKIPHHGSENGHCEKVWAEHLEHDSTAILTPFTKGRVSLPTRESANAIDMRASHSYITSSSSTSKYRHPSNVVNKMIHEGRSLRLRKSKVGQIRLRKPIRSDRQDAWNCQLFGSALPLSNFIDQLHR